MLRFCKQYCGKTAFTFKCENTGLSTLNRWDVYAKHVIEIANKEYEHNFKKLLGFWLLVASS